MTATAVARFGVARKVPPFDDLYDFDVAMKVLVVFPGLRVGNHASLPGVHLHELALTDGFAAQELLRVPQLRRRVDHKVSTNALGTRRGCCRQYTLRAHRCRRCKCPGMRGARECEFVSWKRACPNLFKRRARCCICQLPPSVKKNARGLFLQILAVSVSMVLAMTLRVSRDVFFGERADGSELVVLRNTKPDEVEIAIEPSEDQVLHLPGLEV